MNKCSRCKGTGLVKSNVQMGVCFKCDGSGDEVLAKQRRIERATKEAKRDIKERKELIALAYMQLNEPKLLGGETRRKQIREDAKRHYKILKEKYNIILSLDEIKRIK